MLCLLQLRVLLLSFWGGGVRRVYFYRILLVTPDSPSPHACTHLSLVWSTMAFYPTTGKTPRI